MSFRINQIPQSLETKLQREIDNHFNLTRKDPKCKIPSVEQNKVFYRDLHKKYGIRYAWYDMTRKISPTGIGGIQFHSRI